jgi:hypothetical protein
VRTREHGQRSPRALGVILMLAGAGFILRNLTLTLVLVLAPAYSSDVLLAPTFVAGLSLTFRLLVKGVDVAR